MSTQFLNPNRTPSVVTTPLPSTNAVLLQADHLWKRFTLHQQGGICLPVLQGVSLSVRAGEGIALSGASGTGKSTFMRCLYGNYRVDQGAIWVRHAEQWIDLVTLQPHELLTVRQRTIGYVSQFLRVIPRVPALTVAAEPLLELGIEADIAYNRVRDLFDRLNLPERLWHLSPTTFSGGEKQRVNLARSLVVNYPLLLLDEPTSALDAANRRVVIELLKERKAQGCALVGIFHDDEVRSQVCNQELIFGQHNEVE
jgi:alpha-D-ribose 1-methylphosphonate 5-triphosphate synthase subunit PhnL